MKTMPDSHKYNHLRDEPSSYLRQHNKNPVKWFPYGPTALQKAKDENKPIFLSIGYSSCHWCHVMSHESFEDQTTADFLNDNFINVKVDREELPDIDSYYQLACQVMNGRGGWPLSAFLTPDMKPYFIGTYFPKVGQEGIPSFTELIENLSKAYKEDNDTVVKNANQIIDTLKQPPKVEHKVEFEGHYPGAGSVLNALKNYQDDDFGGYGVEPKFPHFSFLEWATEHILEGMVAQEFGNHIIKSIELMFMGGIYDHARGGVHRYAIDKQWVVPHFEKMLYDQAGLLKLLSKASLIYPSPLVYDALIQTIDYLNTEMLSEENYFFSGQDADSEGIEGLYFTFSKDEFIEAVLQFDEKLTDKMETYLKWFSITEEGNFERNLNVINLNSEFKDDFYSPEGWNEVRQIRQALAEARKMRIPPATDNKGVASWNFQILSALLDVVQYCKVDAIQQAALELYAKVNEGVHKAFLYDDEKGRTRIKTTTTRGTHVPLFEDYVFFADYCFRSYEIFGDKNFLENAKGTLDFIFKDFHKGDIFYTRAISFSDTEEYENIHTPIFDQSYKSPLGNLISLCRKWATAIPEYKEHVQSMQKTMDNLTHLSLQNPLAFGETLRALVYPEEAYRKIEVPLTWLKNHSFQQFFTNFSTRFALSYHENENENWQICTTKECELQGSGIEEFGKVFSSPEEAE
jgi:uncharacterized protein YyaL (SSP411 family)